VRQNSGRAQMIRSRR